MPNPLKSRLLEHCRLPDGTELPDYAEPWGIDVQIIREAAEALSRAPIAEGGGGYQSVADRVRIEAGWFLPGGKTPETKAPDRHALLIEAAETIEQLADLNHKFKWQVRDTCVRAEKAEAAIESLSRQGGEAYPTGSDREVLTYLMQQFDAESWVCERCGHEEDTATMDSAHYLRQYLGANPTRASEAGDSDLLNVIDLIRTGKDGRKYDYAISRADTMVHVAPLFAAIAAAPAPGGG